VSPQAKTSVTTRPEAQLTSPWVTSTPDGVATVRRGAGTPHAHHPLDIPPTCADATQNTPMLSRLGDVDHRGIPRGVGRDGQRDGDHGGGEERDEQRR